jgi:hypothetical protein
MKIAMSLSALGVGALSLAALTPASEGKRVDYSFREAPINSLGIRSMADLRGKPVVIEFWGRN